MALFGCRNAKNTSNLHLQPINFLVLRLKISLFVMDDSLTLSKPEREEISSVLVGVFSK